MSSGAAGEGPNGANGGLKNGGGAGEAGIACDGGLKNGGGAGEAGIACDGGLKNDGGAGEAATAEPPKVGTGFGTRRSAKRATDGGNKKTSQEFIPSTIYTMGRTGPVPVSSGAEK